MKINPSITLSVCVIAYNHGKFIEQTLKSILEQQVNFRIEVIVGDDFSTDNTREILLDYEKKFPNTVKLLFHSKNLGPKGFEGKNNFISVLSACTGKYIALCDGDDYWIDKNKLQQQVDFLEANPDYTICFHAVNILQNETEMPSAFNRSNKEETYSILDLAIINLMHTPSVIFRNGLFEKFPDCFNSSPGGDYILHLLNAKKGLIKYLPQCMAVYRMHSDGFWSQKDIGQTHPRWLSMLDNLLAEDFSTEVISNLKIHRNRELNVYIDWLLKEKKYDQAKEAINKFCLNNNHCDVQTLSETFINKLVQIEDELKQIKSSRFFYLSSKLSKIRNKISFKN